MANFYIYFISSLPLLHFEQRPPFNLKRFLEMCAEFIPREDLRILENLPQPEEYLRKDIREPLIRRWVSFDTALRNEVAKIRAIHLHKDAAKYVREEAFTEASLAQLALSSHRNPSLTEAEKMLDSARWDFLEEAGFGHYFDLDFLIIYAYKLMIIERWENFRTAEKEALLEAALGNT